MDSLGQCERRLTMDDLVRRFLSWPVPSEVSPDGTPGKPGRIGTNLLTSDQAKKMLEHVFGDEHKRLTRVEAAAELACGLLWMTSEWRQGKTDDAYKALLEALGGSGSKGLGKAIQRAMDSGAQVDAPPGCYWPDEDDSYDPCDAPPIGWRCTRSKGHSGPCAAVACPEDVDLVEHGMQRLRETTNAKASFEDT